MSTLNEIVTKQVENAMGIVDSFLDDIVYKSIDVGVYDSATDTVAETTQTFTFRALASRLSDKDKVDLYPVGAEFGFSTRKLLFPPSYVNGVFPKLEDTLTVNGVPYEVIKIGGVPGKSINLIFISRAS